MRIVNFQAVNVSTNFPLPGASVAIYLTGTTILASLYTLTGSAQSNPVKADSNGYVVVKVPDGTYDIITSLPGYVSPRLVGVQTYDLSTLIQTMQTLQQFGGSDDGKTLNDVALATAKSALPANTILRLPIISSGYYNFAAAPDFGTLIPDIDPGVSIQTAGPPTKNMHPLKNFQTLAGDPGVGGSYNYLGLKRYVDVEGDKSLWLTPSDFDQSVTSAINATTSALSHISVPFGSDTVSAASPYSKSADTIVWNLTISGTFYLSLYSPSVGDRISCCFPILSELYYGAVAVFGTGGYQILYFSSTGTLMLLTKATGVPQVLTGIPVTYPSYHTYLAPYSVIGITMINGLQYEITVDGMPVGSVPTTALGAITSVGFGAYQATSTAVSVPVTGWVKQTAIDYGMSRLFTLLAIGDSITAPGYGQWTKYAQEALNNTAGLRCIGIDNRAVAGQTSAQQLMALMTAGPGVANAAAVIAVGTNDIQAGYPVGAAGAANTYIDNLYQMFNYLDSHKIPVVFVVPPLFYSQTLAGGYGTATSNYDLGAPYRMAAMRLCATLGIKVVNPVDLDGLVIPDFIGGISDPTVKDNIHPTGLSSLVRGNAIARALAPLLLPQPSQAAMYAASFGSGTTNRNRLRNASFAINQRAVSGTVTLAAGAYGHDGVKGGASGCTYTFAASGLDTTLTIIAGSLVLPIEAGLIEGGVYIVSNAATAQARVWQGTGASGSGRYQTTPFTVSGLIANTQTNVEFSTGTVLLPKLEPGTVVTPFERQGLADALRVCQRYFEIAYGSMRSNGNQFGCLGSRLTFLVPKRATPTISNVTDGSTNQSGKLSGIPTDVNIFGVGLQAVGITSGNEYYNYSFSCTAISEI